MARITNNNEHEQAKDALKWALTHVAAALASIATLVQYILIYMGAAATKPKLILPNHTDYTCE